MLREVNFYTTEKKVVLAGDYVECYRMKHLPSDRAHVGGEVLFSPDDSVEVNRYPVERLCWVDSRGSHEVYYAVDNFLREIIDHHKNQAEKEKRHADAMYRMYMSVDSKLREYLNMTLWQRLKFLFTGHKENN